MNPTLILITITAYFAMLYGISVVTSRGAGNEAFFVGERKSPWYIVAFGMIGASLSGVTFISVPGMVGADKFSYLQMVLGYLPGYAVIAFVLLPLYYRLQLTSIYGYLGDRFGRNSYLTGAWFFLLSRSLGSAARLYLVAEVLQFLVFKQMGVPFVVTVVVTIALIWVYTRKGGIRTIIWTDTFQTLFMLVAVGLTVVLLGQKLGWSIGELITQVHESPLSRVFFFDDPKPGTYFWKQFLGGMFIAIAMTGLDQDMMQKNLS
ncbi:MAG TPA: sodium:solute symporter, partial [Flavobacteriales bacterium]|nr:sodium:solute symporter [Flavobacteriales bacterium]